MLEYYPADPPGEWDPEDLAVLRDAQQGMVFLQQATTAVLALSRAAAHAASLAEMHKNPGNHKHRNTIRLFVDCNAIYEDATGRKPGGSRTGEMATGPCVRFYVELLRRVCSRSPKAVLDAVPGWQDELALTDRAILERIQKAEAIRRSRRDE
jgi:hypothetical protein